MALLLDKMVKFRRQKYEDINGEDGVTSPSIVEFQSVPSAVASTPNTPTPNTPQHVVYKSFPEGIIIYL